MVQVHRLHGKEENRPLQEINIVINMNVHTAPLHILTFSPLSCVQEISA